MEDNKSSKLFLAVAVILAVLASVMAFVFINASATPPENKPIKIVVAARDLPSNTALDPSKDFSVLEIPSKFKALAQGCIDPNAMANYKGEMLGQALKADQPILLADFSLNADIIIREPNRLITIPANPGIVVCGDYVKVANANGLMLGGGPFRVIAVGGMMKRFRNPSTLKLEASSRNVPKTISLEVTEAQAAEIDKGMSASPDKNFLIICPPPQGAASRP